MKFFRSIFYVLLFIILVSPSRAQRDWWSYVSPGVRLGYVFGGGFTWSTEITLGVISDFFDNNDPIFSSIALGYQHIPNNPTSFTYVAVQGGYFLFGLSAGFAFYKDKGVPQIGRRLSGFGGAVWGFVSYDYLIFPSLSTKYQTLGVWGKFPIPLEYEECGSIVGTCFGAGTKVKMAYGSLKNIENIKVGDKVLSYNLGTQQFEPDEVLELYSPMNDNMMEMKFSDGTVIRSTFDHPYYAKDKGWSSLKPDITKELITNITEVGQLEEGDICYVMKDGELTEVEFLGSQRLNTFQRTYTIKKLKKNNAFFADGVLVGVETVKEIKSKTLLGYLK